MSAFADEATAAISVSTGPAIVSDCPAVCAPIRDVRPISLVLGMQESWAEPPNPAGARGQWCVALNLRHMPSQQLPLSCCENHYFELLWRHMASPSRPGRLDNSSHPPPPPPPPLPPPSPPPPTIRPGDLPNHSDVVCRRGGHNGYPVGMKAHDHEGNRKVGSP